MTYWLLNAVFLAPVIVVAVLAARRVRWAAIGLTAALLLVMTAVFDNIMIGVGLVDYDPRFISGVFIGVAPLEDFAYALAAIVGLPSVWHLLAPRAASLVEPLSLVEPPLLVEPVETTPAETDPR